ncbi:MAG TPA: hypothetical protein PK941_14010 [Paludibacter sp.]|nr:hypothetical protein [Paludibacter sp.]
MVEFRSYGISHKIISCQNIFRNVYAQVTRALGVSNLSGSMLVIWGYNDIPDYADPLCCVYMLGGNCPILALLSAM